MFIKISETVFLWHLQIKVVLKMLNYSHIFVKHLRIYKEMHAFFRNSDFYKKAGICCNVSSTLISTLDMQLLNIFFQKATLVVVLLFIFAKTHTVLLFQTFPRP